MKILSCLRPKSVWNASIKRFVNARCGQCPACRNARAANWVQRLEQERYYSPFTFFVTFQYDELHVAQFIRLRDEDNPNTLPSYIDSETGTIISLSDLHYYTEKDIAFCEDTKILNVPCVRDFQLFMKKLRKHINKHYGKTGIRYFCAFEIGPSTYRPHSHCLFFLQSALLAQDFARLLSKSWCYGRTFDPHPVTGNASQYVAAYVNSFVHCPAIYLHPSIRPKALFSKRPPIGFSGVNCSLPKDVIFGKVQSLTLFNPSSKTFSDVPLWRSLQCRIFPIIPQFNALTYLDRVNLYRLGKGCEPEFIRKCCVRFGYFRNFYTKIKGTKYYRYNDDSFKRFCSLVRRACAVASSFGLSIEYYVFLMSDYYDKKPLLQLADYYRVQNEYFKIHPVSDLLSIDPRFVKLVNGRMYDDLDSWQKVYFDLLFPNLDKTKPIFLDYKHTFIWNELYKLHDKIFSDNTKTKLNTDYLMAHSEQFQNIINFKFL